MTQTIEQLTAHADLRATVADVTADRDEWQRKALAMLEIVNAVEEFVDASRAGKVSISDGPTRKAYRDLVAMFRAFRAFTEAGVPADWVLVLEEPGEAVEEDVEF
jgi:hypothetical protein